MYSKHLIYLIVFLSAALFAGCKKEFEGERDAINPPETYMVVDSIYRTGDARYTTTVVANWWGIAFDGFIKGYEISTDNGATWLFTTKQQDVFLLSLPVGADTADINILVRAIDNRNVTDPTPASLFYPVKNSIPTIAFDFSSGEKLSSFPAFRYSWLAKDADGAADLSRIEIALNDTVLNRINLPANTTAASFIAEQTGNTFTGAYQLFLNAQTIPFNQKLNGAKFDTINTIYIRSIDRTGASSSWVNANILVRKPKNGLLLINDYTGNKNTITNFYANQLIALGTTTAQFDTVISFLDEFPADAFTTSKALEFFNRIVWVTDNPTQSLGTAQTSATSFFNKGGRIFMVLEIPSDVALDAPFFSFTPIQRLVENPGRSFRMATGDRLIAYGGNYPELRATSIITFPRPFISYSGTSGLYSYDSLARAELRSFGPGGTVAWTGNSNVMSKRINTQNNKPDFITLTVPLHLMNGNNNVNTFFREAVINELSF